MKILGCAQLLHMRINGLPTKALWETIMKKALLAASAAIAAMAYAPAANASVSLLCAGFSGPAFCTFTEAGMTGGFSNSYAAGSSFQDYFGFTLSSTYRLSVTSTKTIQVGGPIILTTSELVKITAGPTVTTIGPILLSGVANDFILGPGLYALHFIGTTTRASSYSGTIDIAPIPEPATWALMVAGIAAVGSTMRRRSHKVRVAFS